MLHDLQYGLRTLIRNPGFSSVAILVLALGIGANTAIFSVINEILVNPLPLEEPDHLVFINETSNKYSQMSVSYLNFLDWREQNSVFEDIAVYRNGNYTLTGTDQPERLLGTQTSSSLFKILKVEPMMGRSFIEDDDMPGASPVVILSHAFWQRRMGSDPDIIGKLIMLDGTGCTVVGITPPDFHYPLDRPDVELYVPLARHSGYWLEQRGSHPGLWAIARLNPGVTLSKAQADLAAIAGGLEQAYPETNASHSVSLIKLQEVLVRETRPALIVLVVSVGLVLLIACTNVANLLLARASARSKEIAIRSALGAGKARIVGQLLTESSLLSMIGGMLGIAVAFWGVKLLILFFPQSLPPMYHQIGIDIRVLCFALVLSILTGLVFGLFPAIQIAKPNLIESLKEGGRSNSASLSRQRFRNALVAAEIAIALVLLISAGLVMRTFLHLVGEYPGFNPNNLLTLQISLPRSDYPSSQDVTSFYQKLRENVRALPGVRDAAFTVPLLGGMQESYVVEGMPAPKPGEHFVADTLWVSPGYFKTMEIPLFRGRSFTDRDGPEAPNVIVVDEKFAELHWPNENPIGKRIKRGRDPAVDGPWLEIVGIVGHVKSYGVEEASRVEFYIPFLQYARREETMVLRTLAAPQTLVSAVRKEVTTSNSELPIFNVRSMEDYMGERLVTRRLSIILLGIFGALAILLAAVGIYGVMAYWVSQRKREIGLRMAIGATRNDVLKLVLRYSLSLVAIGVGAGLAISFLVTRFLASQLFGVSPTDPATFTAIAVILTIFALLASFFPAFRAARVAPEIALRSE